MTRVCTFDHYLSLPPGSFFTPGPTIGITNWNGCQLFTNQYGHLRINGVYGIKTDYKLTCKRIYDDLIVFSGNSKLYLFFPRNTLLVAVSPEIVDIDYVDNRIFFSSKTKFQGINWDDVVQAGSAITQQHSLNKSNTKPKLMP